MQHSVALLEHSVNRKQILGVIIPYHRKGLVFALLGLGAHDRHSNLDISVFVADTRDEIAFELTDMTHAHFILLCG